MAMINIFLWLSMVVYGFLFVWWSKKDVPNLICKCIFFSLFTLCVVILVKSYSIL